MRPPITETSERGVRITDCIGSTIAPNIEQTKWMQDGMQLVYSELQANVEWIGLQEAGKSRMLDYACGTGVVARVRAKSTDRALHHRIGMTDIRQTRPSLRTSDPCAASTSPPAC